MNYFFRLFFLTLLLSSGSCAWASSQENHIVASPEIPNQDHTIIEFFNYGCVYCFRAERGVEEAMLELGERYKLIRIPLTLRTEGTLYNAALAAVVLDENGILNEHHRYMFNIVQAPLPGELKSYNKLTDLNSTKKLLLDLGTSPEKIELSISRARNKIKSNIAFASSVGVYGTPAFLINGKVLISGLQETRLAEQALKKNIIAATSRK